ncbi:helix-turn-helix transcriptional regulator [Maribacter antarcticus]|uniref:helix-turn-helix transcriptional regulator n=1 Tax=Maribacter antarcticus TaxID=505250 RepID=UPI000478D3CF|nr:AraC family transcriptional regulator [Maribacter antarcticus]
MQIQITTEDFYEMVIENSYGKSFSIDECEVLELSQSTDFIFGKGTYREIIFNGVHIGYGLIDIKNPTALHFNLEEEESIGMHFILKGSILTSIKQFGNQLEMQTNEHSIFYSNGISGKANWKITNGMELFEINLSKSFFERYQTAFKTSFPKFKKAITEGTSAIISKQMGKISPKMLFIIKEIINCQHKGIYKRLFLESKIIELLILQIESLENQPTTKSLLIKPSEIEKIHYAKEVIISRLNNPLSLTKLAREIQTNECTLKKGFKEVYGTTVFKYINDLKMNEAKQLLLEGSLYITEIADRCGYKNATHFSAAFKRKFGLTPSLLKLGNHGL